MAVGGSSKLIGVGRPGGPGGNKVAGSSPSDATRKARPADSERGGSGQHTGIVGDKGDPTRKARPKSSGTGQSTKTK